MILKIEREREKVIIYVLYQLGTMKCWHGNAQRDTHSWTSESKHNMATLSNRFGKQHQACIQSRCFRAERQWRTRIHPHPSHLPYCYYLLLLIIFAPFYSIVCTLVSNKIFSYNFKQESLDTNTWMSARHVSGWLTTWWSRLECARVCPSKFRHARASVTFINLSSLQSELKGVRVSDPFIIFHWELCDLKLERERETVCRVIIDHFAPSERDNVAADCGVRVVLMSNSLSLPARQDRSERSWFPAYKLEEESVYLEGREQPIETVCCETQV